jgi:hypothetical protein
LITPSSLSAPKVSSALPDIPSIMPLPIPIPKIARDTNTADLTSDPPDFLCPSHLEPADPPASIPAFTLPGTADMSIPRMSPPSYVNGPFRVWRQLSTGGFARAIGAEDMASGRLLCLKVFSKDRLKHNETEEGLLNELKVYKRLASLGQCRPATIFLMELEMSFQTKEKICFVMVGASLLCAI